VRRTAAGLALGTAAIAAGCITEVDVDIHTRVVAAGGIERRVELRAWDDRGMPPGEDEVLGVSLADPGAWPYVEERPGFLRAEGYFSRPSDLPGGFVHEVSDDGPPAADRVRVEIVVDDLVVLTRWSYRESYGDPIGPSGLAAAVDRGLGFVRGVVRAELRRALGDDVDLDAADRFLNGEVRALATEAIAVRAAEPGRERRARREAAYSEILARRGIAVPAGTDGTFWDRALPDLLRWGGAGLADAISTADSPVAPERLSFWPRTAGELDTDDLERWSASAFGDPDAYRETESAAIRAATTGYRDDAIRWRFRFRTQLPGTVLRTNGTPDDPAVVWFVPGSEIASRDLALEIVSVEPRLEALRAVGAKTSFTTVELAEIERLLGAGDPDGVLRGRLRRAVERGSLEPLVADGVDDEFTSRLGADLAVVLTGRPRAQLKTR